MLNRIGVFVLALSMSTLVDARALLTWTPPIQRENGVALSISEISEFTIEVTCNAREVQYFSVDPTATEWTSPNSIVGNCRFRMRTLDAVGPTPSKWSNSIDILIKLNGPKRGGFR